ncbi:MAG: pyridoxal phosphate-dependent aminotransferase family protein [Epsilonproteobacteria bacterium]|nr:pyridoxal phosphate-dependent aminotransferase family protein [Campylobacterota bacterium]
MYEKELEVLAKKGRLRKRVLYDESIIDLASNDYLGLAENEKILHKAYLHAKEFKSHSAKASMLVNGYHPAHKLLEDYLKKLNGFEEALVLGSGFLANMALFELGRKGDLFLVDSEYHASGITGAKLTSAEVRFFKHNDLNDLMDKSKDYKNFNRVFVAVEGVYSMEGDKLDKNIALYAHEIGTLIVDEAHSVGTCGERLMGITEEYSLDSQKTIKMGTLGKALGSYGAYILANKEIIEFLLNRAKSVIYTTALSPFDSLLAFYALKEIEENLQYYKSLVFNRKLIYNSNSLIKILKAKNISELMCKHKKLLEHGILVGAIRPPTVKEPIFRIILRTNISDETIKKTLSMIGEPC